MSIKKRRRFTDEFRAQAVEMVEAGSDVPTVAADLEVEPSCLYTWVRNAKAKSQPANLGSGGQRAVGEEAGADEIRRLRAENARLSRENVVLKKAAIILGTSNHSRDEK